MCSANGVVGKEKLLDTLLFLPDVLLDVLVDIGEEALVLGDGLAFALDSFQLVHLFFGQVRLVDLHLSVAFTLVAFFDRGSAFLVPEVSLSVGKGFPVSDDCGFESFLIGVAHAKQLVDTRVALSKAHRDFQARFFSG